MTTDIRAAAELNRLATDVLVAVTKTNHDEGGPAYTCDHERFTFGLQEPYELALFTKGITDQRPLAELGEEEWRAMGAGKNRGKWSFSCGSIDVEYSPSSDRILIRNGFNLTTVVYSSPTVGQLNALMFAVGRV